MRVFTVVAMKTREQYGHGDAGAAVQLAGEGVPRADGPESDDVRHEGAGRPEPDAPARRRTLAVAENGGPGCGVRGGLRPGLGRPSDSAPRPPAPEAFVTGEENEEQQSDDRTTDRTENEPATRFLRRPEVTARTGLSRSTIQVRLAEGRFPRPVSLGSRAVGWIEAEVDEWIRQRIVASRGEAE